MTGKVYGTHEAGTFLLVNLGGKYPKQILTIVLKSSAVPYFKTKFPNIVTAIGKVTLFDGRPEITVSDTNHINFK